MNASSQADPPELSQAVLRQVNARLRQQLEQAELKIRVLEERLRLERIARYGKRSETLSDLQLQLLDLEPGVSSEEIAAESEREPVPPATEEQQAESANKPQAAPGRKHPGRQKLPSHLARVEQVVACTGAACQCAQCGAQTQVIGYEETEVLDVRPAEYFVTVIKREKRACAECPERGVSTAPAPERIVAKSLLSDQLIIDLVVNKYCESLPLYRQQAVLRRDGGVEIARSTLDDAVMRVGELLLPIAAAMKRDLLAGRYLQAGRCANPRPAWKQSSGILVAIRLARQRRSLRLPHGPRRARAEAVVGRFRWSAANRWLPGLLQSRRTEYGPRLLPGACAA